MFDYYHLNLARTQTSYVLPGLGPRPLNTHTHTRFHKYKFLYAVAISQLELAASSISSVTATAYKKFVSVVLYIFIDTT
jgi:hypothetical protein